MNEDILKILDKIEQKLSNEGIVSIYKGYTKILSSQKAGLKKISEDIKETIEPLSKDIKVYKIVYSIDKKWKLSKWIFGPFVINIAQLTLTKDLNLKQNIDDKGQSITYSLEELLHSKAYRIIVIF